MWFIGGIFALLILAFIILQLPVTQRYITHKAESYLQAKLKTRVLIGEINFSLPKSIFLGDVYIESLQHDTLVYSHSLKVDIDMFGLMHHRVTVNSIRIEKFTGHIKRAENDSDFNYSFIIKAFSSPDQSPKPASTNGKPYKIEVKRISLNDIYATYYDLLTGMVSNIRMGRLDIDIRDMNLDKQIITVKKIDFSNTIANIFITKASLPDTSKSKPNTYRIKIEDMALGNIKGQYKNTVEGQTYSLDLNQAYISNSSMSMASQKIGIGSISLDKTFALVSMNENSQAKPTPKMAKSSGETPTSISSPGWTIMVDKINMKGSGVRYDDQAAKPADAGMDFSHMNLTGLNIIAKSISYTSSKSIADILQLGFIEKSGFAVHTLRTHVLFDSVETIFTDFDINTGNTHVSKYVAIHYISLKQFSEDIGSIGINADIPESIIGYRDILYFVPGLAKTAPFSKDPDGSARIACRLNGRIGDLNLNNVAATAGSGTLVHVSGRIQNLPDINKAVFDLDIAQANTTKMDIFYFSPPHSIPTSINIPPKINTKGYFRGRINDFKTYISAQTTYGNATADLSLKMPGNHKDTSYSITVSTHSLQLGLLLNQQKTLGPLTMKAVINGTGLALPSINANINAHITEAVAMKYPYKNMDINGHFKNQAFDGNASVNDSNLQLAFKGLIGIEPGNEKYDFVLNVEGADLKALHLMDSDFRFKGLIKADISENSEKEINGTAGITNVEIDKDKKTYTVRTFAFFSAEHKDNDSISIRSDFMNADFSGTLRVTELPALLEAHLNRYFKIPGATLNNFEAQKFRFHIDLGNTDMITDIFYPNIQKLETGPINGYYDSKADILKLNIQIPEIEYDNITIDSLMVKIGSDPVRLNYDISIKRLNSGLTLKNIGFDGKIEHDSVNTRFSVKDDSGKTAFMVAAAIRSINDEMVMNILPKGFIVNYIPWDVTKDNYLKMGREIYVHDLALSHKNGKLVINSPEQEGTHSPLNIDFKDFSLAEFTRWMQKDTLFAGGTVNGNVFLKNLDQSPEFNVKLAVDDFSYKNDSIGNLTMAADNSQANRYAASVIVSGRGNDASVKGFYATTGKKPEFNFETNVGSLTMKTIAPFVSGELSDMDGSLKGKLLISGSSDNLNIIGKMHFTGAQFTLDYLNTHYKLDDGDVLFNKSNIEFDDFKILDSANHSAIVNGYIYTKYFSDFGYDLKVKSDHFLALNSLGKKGALFYGKLLATSDVTIKGKLSAPVINVNAHLEKGTTMTVILPGNEPEIESTKGVLFFADINRPQNKILHKHKKFDTTQQTEIKGLVLTSNIEVDKDAYLKIIVDPEAGDYLEVKGAGTLSLGMRTDGTMSLTGRYEIQEGSYQLTFYNFIKRRFTIQPGGSITWVGAPMEADLNLTAMYETRAAPLPILEPELSGLTAQERNLYLEQLRFQVLLKMTGSIKKPDIDMDITLNDLDKAAFGGAVIERLTEMELDKSEINKQVFALLVLDRFIDENPFQSDQPGIVQSIAYTSVSELISQQLNNISSKLIKRGSLSFDIRSYDDYSTGIPILTNEFKANLQQRFLKDRLAVNLGGEVNVVGVDRLQPQASPSNQAISDISIEYMLTKDGRYRVTLFRDNSYAGLIEGQIIETGVGFVFVKDFDSFENLFDKPKNTSETIDKPPVKNSSPK